MTATTMAMTTKLAGRGKGERVKTQEMLDVFRLGHMLTGNQSANSAKEVDSCPGEGKDKVDGETQDGEESLDEAFGRVLDALSSGWHNGLL